MENNDKNLDNLFKDAAAEYKRSPTSDAWNKINKKVQKKESGSTVFIKILQVAAAVILLFVTAYIFFPSENSQPKMTEIEISEERPSNYSANRSQSLYKIYNAAAKGEKFKNESINL